MIQLVPKFQIGSEKKDTGPAARWNLPQKSKVAVLGYRLAGHTLKLTVNTTQQAPLTALLGVVCLLKHGQGTPSV